MLVEMEGLEMVLLVEMGLQERLGLLLEMEELAVAVAVVVVKRMMVEMVVLEQGFKVMYLV